MDRRDLAVAAGLALLAAAGCFAASARVDPVLYERWGGDIWFQADAHRVFKNETNRLSDGRRNNVHPLFPLAAYPPVFALQAAGLEPLAAVRLFHAGVAGLWLAGFFLLLRRVGCRRGDAALFGLAGAASAAAVFWFPVAETYSVGALTILAALLAAARAGEGSFAGSVLMSAATLSITVTNWMAGLLAVWVRSPWKRAVKISAAALFLVFILSLAEKAVFPRTGLFFLGSKEEGTYMLTRESGGPPWILRAFFFHAAVTPALQPLANVQFPLRPLLSVQSAGLGTGGPWGAAATAAWAGLLGLGAWALLTLKTQRAFRTVLGGLLLGQLGLHVVYGEETFLYALHFFPLLLAAAALAALTRARPAALALAALFVVAAGVNNVRQWAKALDHVRPAANERVAVLRQMAVRPAGPWPRGTGHALLAFPGSADADKSYFEPGGSFSPTFGSFGVSFWVLDAAGRLKATSDDLPLEEVRQKFEWARGRSLPGVRTRTPHYEALWTLDRPGAWTLRLAQTPGETKTVVMVRSVGPAGGPLHSARWDGRRLLLNDRWALHPAPAPAHVSVGDELIDAWPPPAISTTTAWVDSGKGGWGYARLDPAGATLTLALEDLALSSAAPLALESAAAPLRLDLPEEFADSLRAQVAHLMMGLAGGQTRPGDPINYPLAWLRDGAYTVAALAAAGRLETAKALVIPFAEEDFFGGFGPEADAPGLALWAMEQVARRADDRALDRRLWPHAVRKAELILSMSRSTEPLRGPVAGPIVPAYRDHPELSLVCEPAREGLIVGRMDWQRPLLFVNATAYRGLMDAAALAGRLGRGEEAARWRAASAALRDDWRAAAGPSSEEWQNGRSYVNALWPSGVADKDIFFQKLENRWNESHDADGRPRGKPLWTYFTLAEAHQWLFSDRPEKAWAVLRWFWEHQASPGLYTWWEGRGEENTFHLWEKARGWVRPPHVTPHYWTASQMLLLQLGALAAVDPAAEEPALLIGAGVPAEWLARPLSVEGIATEAGVVDWRWRDGRMTVVVRGGRPRVRLGASFPPGAPLRVEYRAANLL